MTRTRRIITVAGAVVAFGGLVVAAGLPVYVFPPPGDADGADLAYVIGPPTTQRVDLAKRLLDTGSADSLLISVPLEGGQSASELSICSDARVVCRHPTPFTTKGEARMLAAYTSEVGVDKTVVVTFTPHVSRTRYIFARCYAGDVSVVAADTYLSFLDWAFQYVYQSAAFTKAWLTPCE